MKLKTFKKFIEENKDITLLSLAWSLYWRIALAVIGISMALGFVSALLEL